MFALLTEFWKTPFQQESVERVLMSTLNPSWKKGVGAWFLISDLVINRQSTIHSTKWVSLFSDPYYIYKSFCISIRT